MAPMLRNRRAQGPMSLGLVNLASIVLAVAIVIVIVTAVNSMILEKKADSDQIEELTKLVDGIKTVCKDGGVREPRITIYPKRGFVYIAHPDKTKEGPKIAATGCKEYCLCTIKRTEVWSSEPKLKGYQFSAYFTGDYAQELQDKLLDKSTMIIGCANLQAATYTYNKDCVKGVSLLSELPGKTPISSTNYWGFPISKQYYGAKAVTFEVCPTTIRLMVKKTGDELILTSKTTFTKELSPLPECKETVYLS